MRICRPTGWRCAPALPVQPRSSRRRAHARSSRQPPSRPIAESFGSALRHITVCCVEKIRGDSNCSLSLIRRCRPFPIGALAGFQLGGNCNKKVTQVVRSERAFPDHEYPPTRLLQQSDLPPVALDVGFEFFDPFVAVGRWSISQPARVVPVPEAPVDEQGGSILRKDKIGAAGQIPTVQPETHSELVQTTTDLDLRFGVLASYGGHDLRACCRVDDISHSW